MNGTEWDTSPTPESADSNLNISSTLEKTPEDGFLWDPDLNLSNVEWNMTGNCSTAEMYDDLFKYSGTVFQSFVFLIGILGIYIYFIFTSQFNSM